MSSPYSRFIFVSGKIHDKHVRRYFMQLATCPASQLPQKATGLPAKVARLAEPLHCEPCNLFFNSDQQMEQHLAGRNHQRWAASSNSYILGSIFDIKKDHIPPLPLFGNHVFATQREKFEVFFNFIPLSN